MDVRQMREQLKKDAGYGGIKWKMRVDRMPDNQVIAVYHQMMARGRLKGAAR